jgi:hypothetical protein
MEFFKKDAHIQSVGGSYVVDGSIVWLGWTFSLDTFHPRSDRRCNRMVAKTSFLNLFIMLLFFWKPELRR